MTTTAEFSIEGSVSGFSPFSDVGKDLEPGETVTLKFESAPPGTQGRFDVRVKSASWVPDITLSPASGVPDPVTNEVTFVAPVGAIASYMIRGIVGDGHTNPNTTKERIVALRSAIGLRHVIVTERGEYEPTFGWAEGINEAIDVTVAAVGGDIVGPGSSTDGAVATWNGATGKILRDNSLALIPPGTGQLQLSERIELGPSPSQQDGLNLSNGQGVYFRTIAGVGHMRGLGIDASDDLLIGDVNNDGSVILRVKGAETVDVEVGGVRKLRVDSLTVNTPSRLVIEPSGFQAATIGDIGLSKSGNIVGRSDDELSNVGMLSLAGDVVTLGSAATTTTAMATDAAGTLLFLTGITQAFKATSTAFSVGATPAPSGTLALPKTSSITASNQGDSAAVPMIATGVTDQLLIGGNVAANKGVRIDSQTGYTVVAGIAGADKLTVSSTGIAVDGNVVVNGVTTWPSVFIDNLDFTTLRTTTNGSLEDVTGASVTIASLAAECRVVAEMSVQSGATTTQCVGGWAISINGTDSLVMERYLSGTGDTGQSTVTAVLDLPAGGPYAIQARHRRTSGAGTVNTVQLQMLVRAYVKPA
jgi:hypothetical protein